jgi:hypothetical protein
MHIEAARAERLQMSRGACGRESERDAKSEAEGVHANI